MIDVRFSCGHTGQLSDTVASSPVCGTCGERQITYVKAPRLPRFVGACTGPYAEPTGVTPGVVNVAPAGPLRLKAPETL